MPRRSKGPYLAIRSRAGRAPVYVIRHGSVEISTECGLDSGSEAHLKLAAYIAEVFSPNTKQHRLDRIEVTEVLTLYARLLPDNSPSRMTRGYQIKALAGFWGEKKLSDVNARNCRAYQEWRGIAPGTVRNELKALQAAVNVWHRESPLQAVPQVTLPRPTPPKERVLERGEVARMLWACRAVRKNNRVEAYHLSRFIRLSLASGTRSGAVLALRWTAFARGGWIDTDHAVLYRRGFREEDTSKRRPPMRIEDVATLAMVQRWKAMDVRAAGTKPLPAVISYKGRAVASVDSSWETVRAAAGLGEDVTPHTLKHTAVTWMLRAGKQPWDVAGIVGTDAVTVQRVYGHHRPVAGG